MTLNLDKSTWKRVALGDVVQNLNVTVKDPSVEGIDRIIAMEHLDPGELKIVRWGDLGDGTTFTRRVRPGQTLFGKRRAYQRKAAYAEFDAICSGDILVFQADPAKMLPEFLPSLVQSNSFYDHALGTSAGSLSPRTNWRDLANYEFDLPPLDKQKCIAELMWGIEEHQYRLTSLEEQARLAAGSWLEQRLRDEPTNRLDQVVSLQHGRPVPSHLYGKEGVPLLRPGDMKPDGTTRWTDSSVSVPPDFAEQNSDWLLSPGDVVINMTAQSLEDRFLGRVCRMHDAALLNQRIGRLRPTSEMSNEFLHLALSTRAFTDWVARRCEGSKVKHMHWRHIQDFPIANPSAVIQNEVLAQAQRWHETRKSIFEERRALSTTKAAISGVIFGDRS